MRKVALYLAVASALLTVFSCTKQKEEFENLKERVTTLEDKVATLEKLVNTANANIDALQKTVSALAGTDWVTSVEVITDSHGTEIGYQLNFHSGLTAKIYHGKDGEDGEDGRTPVVQALKASDGKYYWHVDGQWLLDENGNKIPVTGEKGEQGVAPQLKIEDDYWYISYDGENWTQLGKATGEDGEPGEPGGDSIFSSVTVEGDCMIMVLHNGEVINLPIGPHIDVVFDMSEKIVIVPGVTRIVDFVTSSNLDTAYYEVFTSEDIKARVVIEDEKGLVGHLEITADEDVDLEYAKLLFFASDGYSLIMKRFAFEEDKIEIVDDPNIEIGSGEGLHTFRFSSNSSYTAQVDGSGKDWITIMDTKLMQDRTITFYVNRNEDEARKANIVITSDETELCLIVTISQAGQSQILSFDHSLNTVTNPGLSGSTDGARVKYGDGRVEYWEAGGTYTYRDTLSSHTVTVVGKDLTGFGFESLSGITGINITQF